MKLEFLPAYSPDFNPIEQAFSKIKSYMRRHFNYLSRSSTGTDSSDETLVYILLHEAVFTSPLMMLRGFTIIVDMSRKSCRVMMMLLCSRLISCRLYTYSCYILVQVNVYVCLTSDYFASFRVLPLSKL